MLRRHFALKLLAAGVLAAPALAGGHSRYVFTSFDPPGSTYTRANAINNDGTITGYFSDVTNPFHGFALSGGVFTQIDVPGGVKTIAMGVNDNGMIVGEFDAPADGQQHGFLLSGGKLYINRRPRRCTDPCLKDQPGRRHRWRLP
jgi:probable HAF family extracellular repeat protein